MNPASLYYRLKETYSGEALDRITTKILKLYKQKQHDALLALLRKVDKEASAEERPAKTLARLVMLYHPDRRGFYLKEIEKYHQAGESRRLEAFSHIFAALRWEEQRQGEAVDCAPFTDPEESGFPASYEWEEMETGRSYYTDGEWEEDGLNADFASDPANSGFFAVMKRHVYGALNVELPFFLLEDMDELELPESGMDDLDGIAYCKHLTRLDLSGNRLTDIGELINLEWLEEVYLADNQIGYIDALGFLPRLRIVDLSNNQVDDISPLFGLEELQYVILFGNPVPEAQIRLLKSRDVVVIY